MSSHTPCFLYDDSDEFPQQFCVCMCVYVLGLFFVVVFCFVFILFFSGSGLDIESLSTGTPARELTFWGVINRRVR